MSSDSLSTVLLLKKKEEERGQAEEGEGCSGPPKYSIYPSTCACRSCDVFPILSNVLCQSSLKVSEAVIGYYNFSLVFVFSLFFDTLRWVCGCGCGSCVFRLFSNPFHWSMSPHFYSKTLWLLLALLCLREQLMRTSVEGLLMCMSRSVNRWRGRYYAHIYWYSLHLISSSSYSNSRRSTSMNLILRWSRYASNNSSLSLSTGCISF